jgi:tetratricopeptide (TPR) repeat protein
MYLHQDALNADAIEQLIPSLKQFDATQKTFADWVSYCAEIYMWEGHNDTAINCVRTGLDASQGQPSHDPLMPWLLMTLLRDHQDQHVLDESDAWHGKQFDPDVTNLIQAARAVAEQRLNRPDDAAHDLKQVCANISAAPAPLTKGNTVSLLLYRELPYEQAVDLLSQAGSGDPVWMCFVMLMCRQHQDYTRAAIMADKIAAATLASDKPEYVNLRYNRALVYALDGQSDKAKALLDSIYWDNRDFPMSMFLEGALTYCDLLNPSDTTRAQQLFNHVPLLSASYSLAFVWDAQGWLLIRSGHMDDGLKYLNAANAIMPSATIHYHLGQAYESQGKHDQALAEWHRAQKILAANPRSFDALYHVTSGYDDLIALPLQHALQASH